MQMSQGPGAPGGPGFQQGFRSYHITKLCREARGSWVPGSPGCLGFKLLQNSRCVSWSSGVQSYNSHYVFRVPMGLEFFGYQGRPRYQGVQGSRCRGIQGLQKSLLFMKSKESRGTKESKGHRIHFVFIVCPWSPGVQGTG